LNKKIRNSIIIASLFLVLTIPIIAETASAKRTDLPEQANPKAKEVTVVSVPDNAREIGPGVFDLGFKIHEGKIVQGTLYVFSDKEFAKPSGTPGNGKGGGGNGGSEESSCYSYITKGAKWRAEEKWNVSTANAPDSIKDDVASILVEAISQWETADGHTNDIMAYQDNTIVVDAASFGTLNNQNEVFFGDYSQNGVIAVTVVWSTSFGPPSQREIVEWDQLYDLDFEWNITGEDGFMDFDNIATHEIGHAAGMGHPDSTCTDETMFAFASNGETKKRDLFNGDIAGINKLY